MKIKTAALTGPALDGAVAKCWYGDDYDLSIPLFDDGLIFAPSTNWAHGGPIIEREKISVMENVPAMRESIWEAKPSITAKGAGGRWGSGPTALIAAMRCFVASRLGDEVEIPEGP